MALIPIMYELPSKKDIAEVVISKEVISEKAKPRYVKKMSEAS
jgi:ATP-dependent protease Clp ATPase subunit